MTEGKQKENWRDFYQDAWALRLAYIAGLIDKGETCPYRITHMFKNHEKKFHTIRKDGKFVWVPKQQDGSTGFLPTGESAFSTSIVRGRAISHPTYFSEDYDRFLIDMLAKDNYDCVVELGSGYGQQLIDVYYNGGPGKATYIGAELTDSGVEAMNRLFALAPEGRMKAVKFDLLEPDFSFLESYKKVFFFSVYAIQQVQEISIRLFEKMAAVADTVTAVHLEPYGFQIEPNLGPATQAHAGFIRQKGWNENLGPILIEAHNKGIINCTFMGAEMMGGGSDPISLAVWNKPTAKA